MKILKEAENIGKSFKTVINLVNEGGRQKMVEKDKGFNQAGKIIEVSQRKQKDMDSY